MNNRLYVNQQCALVAARTAYQAVLSEYALAGQVKWLLPLCSALVRLPVGTVFLWACQSRRNTAKLKQGQWRAPESVRGPQSVMYQESLRVTGFVQPEEETMWKGV